MLRSCTKIIKPLRHFHQKAMLPTQRKKQLTPTTLCPYIKIMELLCHFHQKAMLPALHRNQLTLDTMCLCSKPSLLGEPHTRLVLCLYSKFSLSGQAHTRLVLCLYSKFSLSGQAHTGRMLCAHVPNTPYQVMPAPDVFACFSRLLAPGLVPRRARAPNAGRAGTLDG